MSEILIKKINEAYIQLKCDKDISYELSEYFTFMVPGAQFTPAFRSRVWDGKIRLYSLNDNTLYHGLIEYLKIFCGERDYVIGYVNENDFVADEFSEVIANKFYNQLKLQSRNEPIEVHSHQSNAFIHSMRHRRALILSPTASGKSLIIYLMVRQLLEYKCNKVIIIVPTTSLVEQLYSDFADYSTENGWNVEEHVHRVYVGKDKSSNKQLIITTWQSVYNLPKEYFEGYDFVIGDEAHKFQAQSLTKIMTNLVNAKYRIGLTGTLDGTKTHKLVLEGLFGAVHKVISTKELIDKNQLAKLAIKCLVLNYSKDICTQLKNTDYQSEIDFLVSNVARNKFIKNLALSMKTNTLVLYQYVDKHGKILYDLIKNSSNIGDRKVFFVCGDTPVEEREMIRSVVEKEKDAIIIASYGTFSTGINIRNLHNVIFASPSKSRIRNLQSIGRVLRTSSGKDTATLYDIADDLRIGKSSNYTLKHFMERISVYNEEKFNYKLYKIGLK